MSRSAPGRRPACPPPGSEFQRLSSLSLVLPAHNESQNLRWLLPRLSEVLPRLAQRFDVIVVDDGSTDGTGAVARTLAAELGMDLKIVRHERKSGYGAAVGDGLRAADLEYAAFTDADGQLDPDDLRLLIPHLGEADLVAGWRTTREDPLMRSITSGVFNFLVRLAFQLDVKDVDCALKIIRTATLRRFPITSRSALINVELYYRVRKLGGRFVQVPVPHYPRRLGRRSGGRLIPILRAIKELLLLRWRLYREGPASS
ncbi:MAG TPA: glycosyltransferase family 2 protein [Candidatus Dormibacteraeota bacterium]|nr:glycosyltransferase family 2 protein [Candidatus Dormibacteraeota bacterium]